MIFTDLSTLCNRVAISAYGTLAAGSDTFASAIEGMLRTALKNNFTAGMTVNDQCFVEHLRTAEIKFKGYAIKVTKNMRTGAYMVVDIDDA